MPGKEHVAAAWIFVDRRLVGGAVRQVMSANELHVVVLFVVKGRTGEDSAGDRQDRGKRRSRNHLIAHDISPWSGAPSFMEWTQRIDRRGGARGTVGQRICGNVFSDEAADYWSEQDLRNRDLQTIVRGR